MLPAQVKPKSLDGERAIMANREGKPHWKGVGAQLRCMALLTVCLWINCTRPAERATCPAIEVSVAADVPSDSTRSVTLTDGTQILLTQTPLLTSVDVTGANASLTEGQYVLNVDVTVEGAER